MKNTLVQSTIIFSLDYFNSLLNPAFTFAHLQFILPTALRVPFLIYVREIVALLLSVASHLNQNRSQRSHNGQEGRPQLQSLTSSPTIILNPFTLASVLYCACFCPRPLHLLFPPPRTLFLCYMQLPPSPPSRLLQNVSS